MEDNASISPCPYFQVSLHATVCGKLCSSYTVSTIQHTTVEVSTCNKKTKICLSAATGIRSGYCDAFICTKNINGEH